MCVMLTGSLYHHRGGLTCLKLAHKVIAAQLFPLFGNTIFYHVIKLIEQADLGRQWGREQVIIALDLPTVIHSLT